MRRRYETATVTDRREGEKTIRRDRDLTHMRRSEGTTTETARAANWEKNKRRTDKVQTHTRRKEETITDTDREEERDRIGKETDLLYMRRREELLIEFDRKDGKTDKAKCRIIKL